MKWTMKGKKIMREKSVSCSYNSEKVWVAATVVNGRKGKPPQMHIKKEGRLKIKVSEIDNSLMPTKPKGWLFGI